nr:hypothetical protein [Candidatus Sulfidibacterium hydrothermale]
MQKLLKLLLQANTIATILFIMNALNIFNMPLTGKKEIKGWVRRKKEKLINEFNPEWKFLNDEIED